MGLIYFGASLTPLNIDYVFLSNIFPVFYLPSAGFRMADVKMISIVRKGSALQTAWISILSPFKLDTWCALLTTTLVIGLIV